MAQTTIEAPIGDMATVTPNDSNNLREVDSKPVATRGIYVGVSGDLSVVTEAEQTITLVNVVAGVWHPIRARRIRSTGTAATDIVAGF